MKKFLSKLQLRGKKRGKAEEEKLLREVLLGPEQMEKHGTLLASIQEIDPTGGPERLLKRLEENEAVIWEAHQLVAESARKGHLTSPSIEWFLDNAYVIEEQIAMTREHFPRGYSKELPRLRGGKLSGYPCIYHLALELISHSDGRVDMVNLTNIVRGYQVERQLNLGELWALPIMLRLALVENLRRASRRIERRTSDRIRAHDWVNRFLEVAAEKPRNIIATLADFVRAEKIMSPAFVAEVAVALRGKQAKLQIVINWIEQHLLERGQSLEQILQSESTGQAAEQISMANSITSLRNLSIMDWQTFVGSQSVIDEELKADPANVYQQMTFVTRDKYRKVVENLSRRSGKSEREVASTAVRLAKDGSGEDRFHPYQSHVGYFLIDQGLTQLYRELGCRPPLRQQVLHLLGLPKLTLYLLTIGGFSAMATAVILLTSTELLAWHWGGAVGITLVLLVFLSQPVTSFLNWLLTNLMPPRGLPRLDFSKGIPDEHRTVAAVPAMLSSPQRVEELISKLELHYLANRDRNISFVLLSDFRDADEENLTDDSGLLDKALAGIQRLNKTYAGPGRPAFFLFHRSREWNPHENIWMGHERKRGKLMAFSRFLRRGLMESFSIIEPNASLLPGARYIITLDADTMIPPESAWKMVGTMAHPLNRPYIDAETKCVQRGYGILQPSVSVSLASSGKSFFTRLLVGETGLDPYTHEVANLEQDVFGESRYIGKGIYDVEAFEKSAGHRFPRNRILSHDLIEGCYARCGFLNDVELIEDHPSQYLADINRRHRWIRGDWQVAAWRGRKVPEFDGQLVRNPLSNLSRWMILDNLRRNLIPPSLLILLLSAWLVFPAPSPGLWTLCLLFLYMAPGILQSLLMVMLKPKKILWFGHVQRVSVTGGRRFVMEAMTIAFLPFEALVHLDAIVRSLWRMKVTKKGLLQWQVAEDDQYNRAVGLGIVLRRMWTGPVVALSVLLVIFRWRPVPDMAIIGSVLVLWLISPVIAWLIGRPLRQRKTVLDSRERDFLRRLARRTWAYFECFVQPERKWLPPDNFQEEPRRKISERISPTSIGMALLSDLAALDFGYLDVGRLVERVSNMFKSMGKLKRHQGHFYNWYDTKTGAALQPIYISTVDSGNLMASLVVLRIGLLELRKGTVIPDSWYQGIGDSIGILREEIDRALQETPRDKNLRDELKKISTTVQEEFEKFEETEESLPCIVTYLSNFHSVLIGLKSSARHFPEVAFWTAALRRQMAGLHRDLTFLMPWLADKPPVDNSNPVPEEISQLWEELCSLRTLSELLRLDRNLSSRLQKLIVEGGEQIGPWKTWLSRLRRSVLQTSGRAAVRVQNLKALAGKCQEFNHCRFEFLYSKARKLLSLGFFLNEHRRDSGFYDLLASEARLCSFLAIAQKRLPLEHWFHLGRPVIARQGIPILKSWSGSMFEYLMPSLIMPSYQNTILDQTCRGAVRRQIHYGRKRGIPWGISESCYNQVDVDKNYQYRAFGVPELGLKRGLANDLVIAPYAAALALTVYPKTACANLRTMSGQGFIGRFGLYEAVDYTSGRVPLNRSYALVKCFMAHHGGMAMLSIAHTLLGQPMQKRFLKDPEMRVASLLLQEKVPVLRQGLRVKVMTSLLPEMKTKIPVAKPTIRVYTNPHSPVPEVHMLSNGTYQVMITSAGGGFNHWKDLNLNRWREDLTQDNWGFFYYLQDVEDGRSWSCTHQPLCREVDHYQVTFSQAKAEFCVRYNDIETRTQMTVSPEDDVEVRSITITNLSRRKRILELTSFAEVILADPRSEQAHPNLNGFFVVSETVQDKSAVLCTRRARSSEEVPSWMFHAIIPYQKGAKTDEVSFETDRVRFIGRGRDPGDPQALDVPGPLSGSEGPVLDPCVSVRRRVTIEPDEVITLNAITGMAAGREEALKLLDVYHDPGIPERVFELAWTHSQMFLHHIQSTEADAQLFSRLAGAVLYANPLSRAESGLLSRNQRAQSDLWAYGISGDIPIVLLQLTDSSGLKLAAKVLQAHGYWHYKGLKVDLVIWADAAAGYRQSLLDEIIGLVNTGPESGKINQPGGIFVLNTEQLSEENRLLLQAVARLVISDRAGSLTAQMERQSQTVVKVPRLRPIRVPKTAEVNPEKLIPKKLIFNNGMGGFTPDGREYVIVLKPGQVTPAPWSNVLANEHFGTVVTESGGSYTWFENAHQCRLTPWYNDPVSDPSGELFYIRDEQTGQFWFPTPRTRVSPAPYICRHGMGYSLFQHQRQGIFSEMCVYVATDTPVKFFTFKLRNNSNREQRLSITGFCEWVIGEHRDEDAMHVVTRVDPETGAIFASNAFDPEFSKCVAFFQSSEQDRSFTADRTEFIGRNRTFSNPEAMRRMQLSNRVGAGMDPCAAMQSFVTIPPGEERQIVFLLGAAWDEKQAQNSLNRFRGVDGAQQALETVRKYWKKLLSPVSVETPDKSIDFMTNYWLPYQTLAGRIFGRSGYYQSGGAFGFRDQLQDTSALLHHCPSLFREHLLTCAGRQFPEGDVQHWWHPPTGRGVRTRISDDYLWLPYAVCRYITGTGDTKILDEKIPFLEGALLNPGEESYYDMPQISQEQATLYEHCRRAIRHAFRFGPHNLPLIGSGDWNDGLNRVGIDGKGESIWLAFFLYGILERFSKLAEDVGDEKFSQECLYQAGELKKHIELHGWDGQWYRRAYFDNGQVLGAGGNPECFIDSIPQSWSILSGAAGEEQASMAMQSVWKYLVNHELQLVQLFTPPFDKEDLDPGYIKGYAPGIRENGGQYTHAAIWVAMALVRLKQAKKAWEVFSMINPINHSDSPERAAKYKVEPYVVAADIYTLTGHEGQGGWTWYTGSAGWMYRLIMEELLGIRLERDKLTISPVLPPGWKSYTVNYRFHSATYHIRIKVVGKSTWNLRQVKVDGKEQPVDPISLTDDGQEHQVEVEVG